MQSKLQFIREIEPQVKQGKGRIRRRRIAIYKCECGNEKAYVMEQVESMHTKQCWTCARKYVALSKIKHGNSKHPLYRKWQDMKNRCYNSSVSKYKNYGGRGIEVCEEWKNNFQAFYEWCLLNSWKRKLEIDRIDVNGNYSPDNCQITTHEENGYNKTNTLYVTYNGQNICFAKLINGLGLNKKYHAIYHKYKKGQSLNSLIEFYKGKIL